MLFGYSFAMLFGYSSAAKQALYILKKIGYNYNMEVCILFNESKGLFYPFD